MMFFRLFNFWDDERLDTIIDLNREIIKQIQTLEKREIQMAESLKDQIKALQDQVVAFQTEVSEAMAAQSEAISDINDLVQDLADADDASDAAAITQIIADLKASTEQLNTSTEALAAVTANVPPVVVPPPVEEPPVEEPTV